jgi:uncharacterized protein (UPF0548 family)
MEGKHFFFLEYVLGLIVGLLPLLVWIWVVSANNENQVAIQQGHAQYYSGVAIALLGAVLIYGLWFVELGCGIVLLFTQSATKRSFGYGLITALLFSLVTYLVK